MTEQITFARHHLATHAIHLAGNGTDATGQWCCATIDPGHSHDQLVSILLSGWAGR